MGSAATISDGDKTNKQTNGQANGNFNSQIRRIKFPEDFGVVSKGLEDEGYEINGEVGNIPINMINISGTDAKQLLVLLEKLEEHEDIQKVYSNFDLEESEMASLL